MPRDPVTGHLHIRTLGDLADHNDRISWHCLDCHRDLALDLGKAIELWGRDRCYIDQQWGIRCAACDSRKIGVTINPAPFKDYR